MASSLLELARRAYTVLRITHCDEEPADRNEVPAYRYSLTAATEAVSTSTLVVVQRNPSTADRTRSDPTVGKVAKWAATERFAHVIFVNLFARRGPHLEPLRGLEYDEVVGPRNDDALARRCAAADVLVLAWGATLPVPGAQYDRRLREVEALCNGRRVCRVGALVQGSDGRRYPRHGRMWNGDNRTLSPLTWAELTTAGVRG